MPSSTLADLHARRRHLEAQEGAALTALLRRLGLRVDDLVATGDGRWSATLDVSQVVVPLLVPEDELPSGDLRLAPAPLGGFGQGNEAVERGEGSFSFSGTKVGFRWRAADATSHYIASRCPIMGRYEVRHVPQ